MDFHEEARLEEVTNDLVGATDLIEMAPRRLDGIILPPEGGEDPLGDVAASYMFARDNTLGDVAQPAATLELVRDMLLDWVILHDLVRVAETDGATRRQLEAMEALNRRMVVRFRRAMEIGLLRKE